MLERDENHRFEIRALSPCNARITKRKEEEPLLPALQEKGTRWFAAPLIDFCHNWQLWLWIQHCPHVTDSSALSIATSRRNCLEKEQ
jgi:hypothetical protein